MSEGTESRLLRVYQILGSAAKKSRPAVPAMIPVSKATWWAGVKSGRYPKPSHCLGQRIATWRSDEILALINAPPPQVKK